MHVSDLHFQTSAAERYKQDEFLRATRGSLEGKSIDLCIFSGDLLCRNQGAYQDAFDYIMSELICSLNIRKLLITCGNHDIDRSLVKPMFTDFLNNISTNDILNEFVLADKAHEFTDNLKHLDSYNYTVNRSIRPKIVENPLYYVDELSIGAKLIALVSLNTAWVAQPSLRAYGGLLYPSTYIFEILKATKAYEFKIFVSHYPIDYLKEFNRIEVEYPLLRYTQCMFSGHMHRTTKTVNYHSSEGLFACSAPSCLSAHDLQHAGYVLFDLDLDEQTIEHQEFHYRDGKFDVDQKGIITLPVSAEKKDAIDVRKALMGRYRTMLEFATKKFVLYEREGADFRTLFTEPVMKYHDEVHDIVNVRVQDNRTKDGRHIPYKELLSGQNYVVWGTDKSGKTSILLKLYIDCITDFNSLQSVPLYIDLQQYHRTISSGASLSLKQLVREEYGLSSRLSEYVLAKHRIIALLDNYDQAQSEANSPMLEMLSQHKKLVLIICCNKQAGLSAKVAGLPFPHEDVYIHGIGRGQMRSLAEKWPIAKSVDRGEIINKIAIIFSQLNISCNYWTVSLFLWIFDRTTEINIHNNVELIDLYIENLLEKPNLALRLSKDFSYENYKDFLAYLAFNLYTRHEISGYAATYPELVTCFEEFKSRNIRVIADSRDVLDYVLDKGVVCSIGGGLYTFRLNGVFEYFLAHYMRIDDGFRRSVITTGSLFLSFGNELEMYSGFKRNDDELLSAIYLNALKAVDLYFERYPSYRDISPEVQNSPKLLAELTSMVATNADRILPLNSQQKDEIQDLVQPLSDIESAVKVKAKYSLDRIDTDILGRHVFILGRVFRGMDSLSDTGLIDEVFDFIIDQGCLIFYFFMKDIKASLSPDTEASAFLDFLDSFSPIISFAFIYDAVGHRNLANLIRAKISELRKQSSPSLYRLFVLYFMLIEPNVAQSLDLIDEIIEIAGKNSLVLQSIMLKLIYYIVFTCDSKQLERELRSRVVEINKKLGRRDRAGNINQLIDRTKIEQSDRSKPA